MSGASCNVRLNKVIIYQSNILNKMMTLAQALEEALRGNVSERLHLTVSSSGRLIYDTYIE